MLSSHYKISKHFYKIDVKLTKHLRHVKILFKFLFAWISQGDVKFLPFYQGVCVCDWMCEGRCRQGSKFTLYIFVLTELVATA